MSTSDPNSPAYCSDESYEQLLTGYTVTLLVIHIIAVVLQLLILRKYIKAKCREQMLSESFQIGHRCSCNLYWLGLVLLLACLIQLIFSTIETLTTCRETDHITLHVVARNVSTQAYVATYFLLIALLYFRLVAVFSGSAFEISRKNMLLFWSFYAVTIICNVAGAWLHARDNRLTSSTAEVIVKIFGGTFMIVLIVVLVASFVLKLWMVHKASATANDDPLKTVITKSSLLTIVSLSMSSVSFALLIVETFTTDIHFYFCFATVACIDVTSNGICIFLTYKHFSSYYQWMCGTCDKRWSKFWTKLSDSNQAIEVRQVSNDDDE